LSVVDRAVLRDFDGTLAARTGLWSGCLAEALAVVAPDLAVEPYVPADRRRGSPGRPDGDSPRIRHGGMMARSGRFSPRAAPRAALIMAKGRLILRQPSRPGCG
jgi:hypothetical protein